MSEVLWNAAVGMPGYTDSLSIIAEGQESTFGSISGDISYIEAASSGKWSVLLRNTEIRVQEKKLAGDGILMYLSYDPLWKIGNRLNVTGELSLFDVPMNPGEFNYRAYYASRGIYYKIEAEQIEVEAAGVDYVGEWAAGIRSFLEEGLEWIFPEQEAGFLKAMLVGNDASLSRDLEETFRQAGLLHILTISGLHVSMIGTALAAAAGILLQYMPWDRMGVFVQIWGRPLLQKGTAAFLIWLYFVMTGRETSAFRAVFMFSLLLAAQASGRSYDRINAAGAAALLLLWKYPGLLFQASFQLSFGAAAAGCVVYPVWIKFLHIKRTCGKALVFSVVIQMVLLPVMAWHFYEYYPYSLAANLLLAPLAAYILAGGAAAACLAHVNLWAGKLAAGPVYYLLRVMEIGGKVLADLPGGTLVMGRPQPVKIIMYYIVLSALVFGQYLAVQGERKKKEKKNNTEKKKMLRFCQLWILPLGAAFLMVRPGNTMSVVSLYTGQGDCHVIQIPGGGIYLIDGGSASSAQAGRQVIIPYLKYKGVRNIRAILISHGDTDHVNGLPDLLRTKGIRIGEILISVLQEETSELQEVFLAAEEEEIPVSRVRQGDSWSDREVSFQILYPCESEKSESDNNNSLVVYWKYRGIGGVMTGDLEEEGEKALLASWENRPNRLTYLKAGHHGSKTSSCDEWLESLKPQVTVISCGLHNNYGHPGEEVLDRLEYYGSRILRTDLQGTVSFYVEETGECGYETFKTE